MAIVQLNIQPALIDQVHDRLLAAIVDGTLAPGRRLTQDGIAEMLGVSRQPVSHALQVLRRRGLLIDSGKRGVAVAPIDAERLRGLYQVREALDGLAAELAADRMQARQVGNAEIKAADAALRAGLALAAQADVASYIDADVAFHSAVHDFSGNAAIGETVSEQWPHFRRSMAVVLATSDMRTRIWREHQAILEAILAGSVVDAGRLARAHARSAGEETARRLETYSVEI